MRSRRSRNSRRFLRVEGSRPPGIYAGADGGTVIVAADVQESSVSPALVPALRTSFGIPDQSQSPVPMPAVTDPALAASTVPWRRELWPWLGAAIFLILIFENFLATRRPRLNPIQP